MEVSSIFINRILSEVVKKKSSSLRLSIGSFPVIKIGGDLVVIENEGIVSRELLTSIINSMVSDDEWKKIEEKREIVLVRDFPGGLRFRINIFFQKSLPTISFYLIPKTITPLRELGLPIAFTDLVNLQSGLIVVAGPFASGKTATVASFIDCINREQFKYIVSIEDPIEHIFISQKSIINQRQIGVDVNSFREGVNYSLGEDIDLVYINGVGQDLKNIITLVLDLSAGNSLVLLEVNTDGSVNALEKILSAVYDNLSKEAARHYLADVLVGILAQRLLPKKGGGRVLAVELLIGNGPVKSLIREGKLNQINNIIESSRSEGMVGMKKSIDRLMDNGEI